MSRSIQPSYRRSSQFSRQAWGRTFGSLVRDARVEKGRTVEQAAAASGIKVAEWNAVEAGRVPENWEQACRMAAGLQTDRMGMATLVLFCREAWDQ